MCCCSAGRSREFLVFERAKCDQKNFERISKKSVSAGLIVDNVYKQTRGLSCELPVCVGPRASSAAAVFDGIRQYYFM